MSGLVLYAIARSSPRRVIGRGLGGTPLRTVQAGGAHVVVSDGAAPEASRAALVAYDRVVRRVMKAAGAALPFRWGTTAADESAVVSLLAPLSDAIDGALGVVADCVQYTHRVYGTPAAASAFVAPAAAATVGPGTEWLAARLRARRAPEIAPALEATAPWVRSVRVERHDRPPLVASAYHLVPRAHARAYRAALARSARTLVGVRLETTGPWPPYAFAELS